MSGGILIALLALLIPIVAIITSHMRRWQQIDVEGARNDVNLRRHVRALDEIDRRVADIERYVTSGEYQLNKDIGRLAGKK